MLLSGGKGSCVGLGGEGLCVVGLGEGGPCVAGLGVGEESCIVDLW